MGNIKTKRRNRLAPQKTRDLALIKLDVRRQQSIEGTARMRLKRSFGNLPEQRVGDPSGSSIEDQELAQIACARGDDSNSDDDDGENSVAPSLGQTVSADDEADNNSPVTAGVSFRATAAQLVAAVVADEDEDDTKELLGEEESDNMPGRQV